jgi:thymidylate synthase (FAD)
MNVRIVSYSVADTDFVKQCQEEARSKEKTEPEFADIQDLIAFCARVSNPSNQVNEETSSKLIKYLIKHAHWSPLEMVNACLEIDTTRDIAHQIVRHRSFAFQEFSQRYANPKEMGDMFVIREARLQDEKNRQNSIELDLNDVKQVALLEKWEEVQQDVIYAATQAYNWAINSGIAKEQARAVLPEGLTKTRLYMNGTLRSWIHYIELRGANGTQKEHMMIAHACADLIAKIFPLVKEL